jgi:hypothetical protein
LAGLGFRAGNTDTGENVPMRRLSKVLIAFGMLMVLSSSARAQGVVAGGWGWGPEFGAQQFGGPGFGGFSGGYGYAPYTGYDPYGYSSYNPYFGGWTAYGGYVPPRTTVNAMGPLMQAIGRTTGRRRGW